MKAIFSTYLVCMLLSYSMHAQLVGKSIVNWKNSSEVSAQGAVDLDWDGDLDIVQSRYYSGHMGYLTPISIQINDGDGHFTAIDFPFSTIESNSGWSRNLKMVDLGNDEQVAVFIGNNNITAWSFLNDNDHPWSQTLLTSVTNAPFSIHNYSIETQVGYRTLHDYDQDGDLDVALVELATGDKKWMINQGQIFAYFSNIPDPILVDRDEEIFEGTLDVNGDGLLDVIGIQQAPNALVWRESLGGDQYGPQEVLIQHSDLSSSMDWLLKDMTLDGILDFIAVSNDRKILFAQGLSTNSFDVLQVWDNASLGIDNVFYLNLQLLPTDYDVDGDLDMVLLGAGVSDLTGGASTRWLENAGNGLFEDPVAVDLDFSLERVLIHDFNNDGYLDLINAKDSRTPGALFSVQLNVESNFNNPVVGSDEFYSVWRSGVFDYNLDGIMDLASNTGNYRNTVVLNAFTDSPGPVLSTEQDFSIMKRVDLDPNIDNECARAYDSGSFPYFNFSFEWGVLDANNELIVLDEYTANSYFGGWADLNGDGTEEFWSAQPDVPNASGRISIVTADGSLSEQIFDVPDLIECSVPIDLDHDGLMEFYYIDAFDLATYVIECDAALGLRTPQLFCTFPVHVVGQTEDLVTNDLYVWTVTVPNLFGTMDRELIFGELAVDGQFVEVGSISVAPAMMMFHEYTALDLSSNGVADAVFLGDGEYNLYSISNGLPVASLVSFPTEASPVTISEFYGAIATHFAGDVNGDNKVDLVALSFNDVVAYINTSGYGCNDPNACNYNSTLQHMASLCCYGICGCTDPLAINYDPAATCDNGACQLAISGLVFHDVNANGIFDAGDYGLANQTITTSDGASSYITNSQGYFSAITGNNNVLLMHTGDPTFPFYTTPSSFQTNLSNGANANFGLSLVEPLSGLDVAIYHDWYLCDGNVNFYVSYRNTGNTVLNGQVQFTYDPLISNYSEVSPVVSATGNTLTFDFENLLPGQMQIKQVGLHTPDFTYMGELMNFSAVVNGYSNSELSASGNTEFSMEHGCSYDPNDIQATPEGYTEAHYIEDGTSIEYLIRFQNTGNAPALNVLIDNTIDQNLDLSSFQFVANSHDVSVAVNHQTRQVQFFFDEIMLPDSTSNEAESHGFVSYRIAIAQPLPTGTEIHNNASIYFDNNPPILTNTTLHTIYNCEDFVSDITVDDSQWCTTQTVHMTTAAPWADGYVWSVNGVVESESAEIQLTEPGEKQITLVVDNPLCGLFEESLTLNLEEVQMQSIQASATTVCEGETIVLSATETSDNYVWTNNGNTLSTEDVIAVATSGNYELTTINGACEQTNSISIVVTPLPDANITQSVNVLSTLANADWTYQWYLNDEPIMGATSSTYEITTSGIYEVVVMNGSCEQSAEINASFIGVEESISAVWSWYPNPVNDVLTFTCESEYVDQSLEVIDVTGRVVTSMQITQTQWSIDMSNWSSGVYTLRMTDGTTIGRVMKN